MLQIKPRGALNSRGIVNLPLLKKILEVCVESQKTNFMEMLYFLVFSVEANLAALRNFLQWLSACLNSTLDAEDLFCWHKQRKWFLWAIAAKQAAENHRQEWGLTWYFWSRTCASIPPCAHSQNQQKEHPLLNQK